MNTVTTQEVQALQATTPAQNMLLVPLSQLRPSKRNVRKTLGASINALAASIQRVGLLQNLTVILASDGEHYEVVAGGRRLAALKLLAKKHRIAKDYAVPCLLVADASARTASLTENVQREAMHPADQFEAFAALIEEGRPIEDIAADFGVTPLVVQRRLPKVLPMPAQMKLLPEGGETKTSPEPADEKLRVSRANAEARIAPTREGYVNAIQVWLFTDGALYQVYAAPGRVTVISLQPGEELVTVAAGDTVRWIVGDTSSGTGDALRVNVMVKPTRSGLKTNLVITTSRRTYLIELTSTERAWMALVSWEYPKDRMLALQRQAQAAQATAPVDTGLSLERIRFRYSVSGSNAPWKPLRAFDDGEKVYIQFPPGIAQGELPPLFVIGAQGDGQLVNYRFRPPYYIVDRLFGAAELRLGGEKGEVVRIERTDGVARGN